MMRWHPRNLSSQVWVFYLPQHRTLSIRHSLALCQVWLTDLLSFCWWRPFENFGFPTPRSNHGPPEHPHLYKQGTRQAKHKTLVLWNHVKQWNESIVWRFFDILNFLSVPFGHMIAISQRQAQNIGDCKIAIQTQRECIYVLATQECLLVSNLYKHNIECYVGFFSTYNYLVQIL